MERVPLDRTLSLSRRPHGAQEGEKPVMKTRKAKWGDKKGPSHILSQRCGGIYATGRTWPEHGGGGPNNSEGGNKRRGKREDKAPTRGGEKRGVNGSGS